MPRRPKGHPMNLRANQLARKKADQKAKEAHAAKLARKKKKAALPKSAQKTLRDHAVAKIQKSTMEKGKKAVAAAKKKIGGATAKPKATKVPRGAGDNWFKALSKKQQLAYIKAHPNSKYAKTPSKFGIHKEDAAKALGGKGMRLVRSRPEKPMTPAQIKAMRKAAAANYDFGEKPLMPSIAKLVKNEHTKAVKTADSLAKKVKTHSDKIKALTEKKKNAKTPTAKTNAKAKIAAAKDKLKSLKEQHKEAKKTASAKKKAAAHAEKRVRKVKAKPAAKTGAKVGRKPVKKSATLKSGKISLNAKNAPSTKGAKASKARAVARKAARKK